MSTPNPTLTIRSVSKMNTKKLRWAPVVYNGDLIKPSTNMTNVLEIDYAKLHYFQEIILKKFYGKFTC